MGSLAERLRDVQQEGCGAIRLNAAITGEPWMKCHQKGCTACFAEVCGKLVDAIEGERSKTEHDGVDVNALLKVADKLQCELDGRTVFEGEEEDITQWRSCLAYRMMEYIEDIRDAVKGANASDSMPLPEGVEWPRFEDGELVGFGEEFVSWDGETHKVRSVEIFSPEAGPDYAINPGAVHNFVGGKKDSHGEFVKRPKPEVLDADGVPIKVGDTVWNIESGKRYEVLKLPAKNAYQSIAVRGEDGTDGFDPTRLTHRKPDSKEALLADIDALYRAANEEIDNSLKYRHGGTYLMIDRKKVDEWIERAEALARRGE